MLLQGWSCLSICPRKSIRRRRRYDTSSLCIINSDFGFTEISEIAHNKVLIAATVSGVIGQLSKPFTSTILDRKKYKFDVEAAFQSGGFPSTHSAAVVATATALGFERGFSDAIFGLAVVYASLVMHDAQGVRREVGVHAKVLNKIIVHQKSFAQNDNRCSHSLKSYSGSESSFEPGVLNLEATPMQSPNVDVMTRLVSESDNSKVRNSVEGEEFVKRLKESVGHSEIEVLAGAFLGLLVSLAVNTII